MRKLLLGVVVAIPFVAAAVACVGDDPNPTTPAGDGGVAPNPTTSSSSSSSSGSSSSSSGGAETGPPPACKSITVTTLTGTGVPGLVNGDGGVAQFNGAEGITSSDDGSLYVSDRGNQAIRKVVKDGTTSTYIKGGGIEGPFASFFHYAGDLIVADTDILFRVTPSPPTANIEAGWGGTLAANARPTGQVFVAATQHCWIGRVKESPSWSVERFAGAEIGPPCAAVKDGDANTATFSGNVRDITFDGTSAMYVSDTGNFRIRKVDEITGATSTLAGSTQGSTDGKGDQAQFDQPAGLVVHPQTHILYVADKTKIRAVTPEGVVTTLVGSTEGDTNGDGCAAKFTNLHGLTFFGGSLYAVDVNQIRKIVLP